MLRELKSLGIYNMHLSVIPTSGGGCRGDSGGPALIDNSDVIGGIGKVQVGPYCIGSDYYNRLDMQTTLEWINSFLP